SSGSTNHRHAGLVPDSSRGDDDAAERERRAAFRQYPVDPAQGGKRQMGDDSGREYVGGGVVGAPSTASRFPSPAAQGRIIYYVGWTLLEAAAASAASARARLRSIIFTHQIETSYRPTSGKARLS